MTLGLFSLQYHPHAVAVDIPALRVGNHRVIFRIEGSIVKVFMIAHRAKVYQKISSRI